jgi:hypothetical protein
MTVSIRHMMVMPAMVVAIMMIRLTSPILRKSATERKYGKYND